MIERYDPFGRVMGLRQIMDRLMEDAFIMPGGGAPAAGPANLAINMHEEGDTYVVEAPMPGVKPEDIDVNIEQGTLTIRGQTVSRQERQERTYLVREHRAGSFLRTLALPEAVDPDGVEATFDNGILRLTLPKSERAKPRRIQIQAGSVSGGQPGGAPIVEGRAADSQGTIGAGASGAVAGEGAAGQQGGVAVPAPPPPPSTGS